MSTVVTVLPLCSGQESSINPESLINCPRTLFSSSNSVRWCEGLLSLWDIQGRPKDHLAPLLQDGKRDRKGPFLRGNLFSQFEKTVLECSICSFV